MSPQQFGTAVHTRLKNKIASRKDDSFKAEPSYWKAVEDFGKAVVANYGQINTLRVDVLEEVADGTVCVYDIKTDKRGFSLYRMKEISAAVHRNYPGARDFFVIEVRPN